MRALVLALALAACATPAPALDPLAFETQQAELLAPDQYEPQEGERLLVGPHQVFIINPRVTAICVDGWVSYSQRRQGTCSGHGGVARRVNWPER